MRGATYHLNCDVQDSFEVKLAAALLEEILKRFAEQVHDHHVEHLAVVCLLVTDEVEEWNVGLAAHLVNQLALPEKHDVPLHLHCFFL